MPKLLYDAQFSFEGGQDASLPPDRLPENKVAAGINITTARGVVSPRFAYDRKALKFPKGGYTYRFNKTIQFDTLFYGGKFQAQAPYQSGDNYYQVVVISGVIFLIHQTDMDVLVLTQGKDTQLNESTTRINWSAAGRFLVLYDFPSRPIIIEGQTARRSDPNRSELPASTMGVYNNSRLIFANAGNEFSAGDSIGNLLTPDAPVTINEILTGGPYVGEIYQAPSEYNRKITALVRLQATDDSTGIGSVLVATEREIFSYNTRVPRAEWGVGQFGSMLMYDAGIVSPRAAVNVNSDLFFVSSDGELRSLSTGRDDQRKWARVPMSVEMKNWIQYTSPDLISYTVLTYFKNKVFWTIRPYRILSRKLDNKHIIDVAHMGLGVLELDNLSRMGSDSPPSWAGVWTGIRPMDMNVNNERMYIMSKDYYSRNQLYEVLPELTYDRAGKQQRKIRSTIYTREHFFQDIFSLKSLQSVELGVSDIAGDFSLELKWRPSHSYDFLEWVNFNHSAPVKHTELCNGKIKQRVPLAFRELKFGLPDTLQGHPITRDLYDNVKRVQLKITLSGDNWKLNQYRLTATSLGENTTEFFQDKLPEDPIEISTPESDWDYKEFGI